jgi:hypothetical protein
MNYANTQPRTFCALLLILTMSCVVQGKAEPASAPNPGTGLEGTISMSPAHPGPEREGIPSSRPLANTDFVVKKGDDPVTSFKTDDQGRFRISLPPGHYSVSRKGPAAKIGNYGPFEVEVVAGQTTKVQWNCDTGMR